MQNNPASCRREPPKPRRKGGSPMTAKARPGAATPGQAVESGRVCETVRPSVSNDTTDGAGRQPPAEGGD